MQCGFFLYTIIKVYRVHQTMNFFGKRIILEREMIII